MNLDDIIEQHLDRNQTAAQLTTTNGLAHGSQGWEPSNLVLVMLELGPRQCAL